MPDSHDTLSALERTNIPSQMADGVVYRLERLLGEGGMGAAFLAKRTAREGEAPVVVKLVRPEVVRASGQAAALLVSKEAVALGRLNERVPPTPFVVRLIDTGTIETRVGGAPVTLPWLALEYIDGGPEGTTLQERIHLTVQRSGTAFDTERAVRTVEALTGGLSAIHGEGVIHRDLTPGNVLCCGVGDDEIFKIADFGMARPSGMAATFGGVALGTPGYAAPEQFGAEPAAITPASDVFSFACVIYYLLTGEPLFRVGSAAQGLVAVNSATRRSVADAKALCSDLRARPSACAAIDAELAQATAVDPPRRQQSASALGQLVIAALRPPSRLRPSGRRYSSQGGSAPTVLTGWQWTTRHHPGGDVVVRASAWDGDGRCLAATNRGLWFWNGTSWQTAPDNGVPPPDQIGFVRRLSAGLWLIGGFRGYLAVYGQDGVQEVLPRPDEDVTFEAASGDLADLGVLVGTRNGAPPLLYAVCGRRWLRPASLSKAASVSSLARLDDETWLVAGRTPKNAGFVARYRPLMWDVSKQNVPRARAYIAAAAHAESATAVVAGSGGHTVRFKDDTMTPAAVPGEPDLSAIDLDAYGRCWVASRGKLWLQSQDRPTDWTPIWSDPSWSVPIVSLFASPGAVIAMSADGGILEGRLDPL